MTQATDIAFGDVPTEWIECRITSVRAGNTRSTRLAQVQANTSWADTIPRGISQQNVWHVIDLRNGPQWHYRDTATGLWDTETFQPNLPSDVGYIDLSAFAIITSSLGDANEIRATFRAPGSDLDGGEYQHQSIGDPGVSVREIQASRVPVRDMCIEMMWSQAKGASPVGWNFLITGYGADCAPPGLLLPRQQPAPTPPEWVTVSYPGVLNAASSSWGGYTLVQLIAATAIHPVAAGNPMRVEISAATDLHIAAASIGVPGGTPQSLTFGGASAVVIPGGQKRWSDPVSLPFGADLAVAVYTTSGTYRTRDVAPGYSSGYATGNTTATLDPAGYAANGSAAVGISAVGQRTD